MYDPSELKILGLTSHAPLGKALKIMLRAIGFGQVEISDPADVCKRAKEMRPTFILFTPEYLASSVQEKMKTGCPCKDRTNCDRALTCVFMKTKTVDSAIQSKKMGFDGIIFADESLEGIQRSLERIYQISRTYTA